MSTNDANVELRRRCLPTICFADITNLSPSAHGKSCGSGAKRSTGGHEGKAAKRRSCSRGAVLRWVLSR